MEHSAKTAREIWLDVKANPNRARFGYGAKAALVNIDLQCAYTRPEEFKTAYETDPRQIEYINQLAERMRRLGWPVIWTHVAYAESGEDAGVWGTRTDTPSGATAIWSIASACLHPSSRHRCNRCWSGTRSTR